MEELLLEIIVFLIENDWAFGNDFQAEFEALGKWYLPQVYLTTG